MDKKIYCKICENCKKACDFFQYEIEEEVTKSMSGYNSDVVTYKCRNFAPIYVEQRSLKNNDIFFKTKPLKQH